MIKIPQPSTEFKLQYFQEAAKHYLKFLDDTKNDARYLPIRKYLGYSNVEVLTYDNTKLKELLIGDKRCLDGIVALIKDIKKEPYAKKLYDNFVKTKEGMSVATELDLKTCPYCNRTIRLGSYLRGTKPEYDHYYPISKYAYLAISLFNLIPCCHDCNNLKRVSDDTIYPYSDEFGTQTIFKVNLNGIIQNDNHASVIDITFADDSGGPVTTIPHLKQIKKLRLDIQYALEFDKAARIIELIQSHNNAVIESHRNSFPTYKTKSDEEILNLVFQTKLNKNDWHKDNYSKFTHDIVKQFNNK